MTGSEGTLGKPLVVALEAAGHVVFTVDQMHTGRRNHLRADVAIFQQLKGAFLQRPEVVIHLAAEFGRVNGLNYPEQMWRTNCIGTNNVIDLCAIGGSHLIFASSSEAYGDIAEQEPVLHEAALDCKVPSFHNEYALTKWANEKQLEIASRRLLESTVIRLFNIYGPGEYYTPYRSVVCRFIQQALTGETMRVSDGLRTLLYVDDFVDFVLRAVDKRPHGAFNVAGSEEVNMAALAAMIRTGCGSESPIEFYKETETVSRKKASTEKAKRLLGWEPKTTLEDGLGRTISWQRGLPMYSCAPVQTSLATP